MIEALFGAQYGAFIAASYAITAVVLASLIGWVWQTYRVRKRTLAALEKAGFGRNG